MVGFFGLVSQILLREGCKKILVADSLSLLQKMHRTQMRGVRVDGGGVFLAVLKAKVDVLWSRTHTGGGFLFR